MCAAPVDGIQISRAERRMLASTAMRSADRPLAPAGATCPHVPRPGARHLVTECPPIETCLTWLPSAAAWIRIGGAPHF